MKGLQGERGEEGPIGLPVSVTWLLFILTAKMLHVSASEKYEIET